MKISFLFLAVLLSSYSLFAQTENRLIINFNAHRNDFARIKANQFKYHFWFPSVEFQHKKEDRILSFELAKFTAKTLGTIGGPGIFPQIQYKDRNTQALIRFQYQKLTSFNVTDSFVSFRPYYGGAMTPHFVNSSRLPNSSLDFPQQIRSVGTTIHASLGVYANFKRFFLTANTLIGIAQLELINKNINNPAIPFSEQITNSSRVKFLLKDNLFRIGFGIKI